MAPRSKTASKTLKKKTAISKANPKGVAKTVARKKRAVKWPLLAQGMFEWYHSQKGSVPDSSIRLRAKEIFEKCYQDAELPKFSDGWIKTWKASYAKYYDEQMLIARSKKLSLNEPETGVGEGSVATSSYNLAATTVEPSNQKRITRFAKIASTAMVSSNDLGDSMNSEGSRNHEVGNNHRSSTAAASGNRSHSTRAEPQIAAKVRPVWGSPSLSSTETSSNNTIQDSYRESPDHEMTGTDAGEEGEDRVTAQRMVSKPGSIIACLGEQTKVPQPLYRNEPNPATAGTVENRNEVLDTAEDINPTTDGCSIQASTQLMTSYMSSTATERDPPSLDIAGDGLTELLAGRQGASGTAEETESFASTQRIPTRPGSPAARGCGEKAFGTWALDVQQQEAPSVHIPRYNEAEGLEDTFIIDGPSSPEVSRLRGAEAFGAWAFDVQVQDAPEFRLPEFPDGESLAGTVIIDY